MAITVNSRILENLYTTAQWAAANPVLDVRVQGYEVTAGGVPVGMKTGDGVTHWLDLPYWFIGGIPGGQVEIPITSNPFSYDTGITEYIPNFRVFQKTGTLYQLSQTAPSIDNGVITTDVYTGVSGEDYFLLVG